MGIGDTFMVVVLTFVFGIWGWIAFRRWLDQPASVSIPESDEPVDAGDAVSILEDFGYEVVHGKRKIPIRIHFDGELYESRLFIDLIARKDGKHYIVKLARDRRPLELTGAAIRERFLPYAFLYEEAEGILYIDQNERTLQLVQFELEL